MLSVAIVIAMAVGVSLLGFARVVPARGALPGFRDLPKDRLTHAQKRVSLRRRGLVVVNARTALSRR